MAQTKKTEITAALSEIINVAAMLAMDTTEARTKRQIEKQIEKNKIRAGKLKKSYDVLNDFINNL